MGDKPGKYWDDRECRWVAYAAPEPEQVVVPEQPAAVEQETGAPAATA